MRVDFKKAVGFLLLLSLVTTVCVTTSAKDGVFSGGNGTAADPYLISTVGQLNSVRDFPDAHFKLIADLTFTESDFSDSKKFWIPIPSFNGVFDGNGHTIRSLKVSASGIAQKDLWGGLIEKNQGTVKNLNLIDAAVSVEKKGIASASLISYSGGIAGLNQGTVSNCTVSGSVSAGRQGRVGGIVGVNEGTVTDCTNLAAVTARGVSSYAGGICGQGGNVSYCLNQGPVFNSNLYAGGISGSGDNISFCGNLGEVSGDYAVGGIVGTGGKISTCYNAGLIERVDESSAGSVQDRSYIGGIVGEAIGDVSNCYNTGDVIQSSNSTSHTSGGISGWNTQSIQNCYNVGAVSGGRSGGISGLNEATFLNCYYLDHLTSGSGYGPDGAIRCTVGEMTRSDTYFGFDFSGLWFQDPYYRYPYPQLNELQMATVVSLEVKSQPTESTIAVGSSFNPSGATVLIQYSDGYTVTEPITQDMLSSLNPNKTGLQYLTVSYGGITATQPLVIRVGCATHKYGTWEETEKATCTDSGIRKRVCSRCGAEEVETVAATGHRYGEWRETKVATCTSSGSREQICSVCSARNVQTVAKKNHVFSSSVVIKQPTCTESGTEAGVCILCKEQRTQEISALGHVLSEAVTVKEATATSPGMQERRCFRCDAVLQVSIPALVADSDSSVGISSTEDTIPTDIGEGRYSDAEIVSDQSSFITDRVSSESSNREDLLRVSTDEEISEDMKSSDGSHGDGSDLWVTCGWIAIPIALCLILFILYLRGDQFGSTGELEEDISSSDSEPEEDDINSVTDNEPLEFFGDE